MKIIKKLVVMLILAVFMISAVTATAHAESMTKEDPEIEAKYKVAKVKVTWNANGGKIGSKKTVSTSVKKGAKLNKLSTPKRSGYTFQGWYTKKSGGKKIGKNTKVSKGVTFFAHWKKARTLNAEEKKLVGAWFTGAATSGSYTYRPGSYYTYETYNKGSAMAETYFFHADGTYAHSFYGSSQFMHGYGLMKGNWAVSTKGTIRLTKITGEWTDLNNPSLSYNDGSSKDKNKYYSFEKNDGRTGIRIGDTPELPSYTSYFYQKR
ncbi:MAG: InlB B-repeat-containing protein [Methanobrevibacter sp.]|nr:InlB B-repeat-containing protein [Methanobrevibacter sp.]